jgi:adenylate cyclase
VPDPADLDASDIGRVAARIGFLLGAANAVGAIAVFVFQTVVTPRPSHPRRDDVISLVVFVVYLSVTAVVAGIIGTRLVGQIRTWAVGGRQPTPADRELALRVPLILAVGSFGFWLIAAVIFAGLGVGFGNAGIDVVRGFVGTVLGGLTTSALSFLLVERNARPLFALALATGDHSRSQYLGLRPRLMLSWTLGSGVPLVSILLLLQRPEPRGAPTAFLAVTGLLVGAATMFIAARSVSDPLDALRAGVEQVGGGDLSAGVQVDDGGEVGLLQAGFNTMVTGLRERERLQDLLGRHVGEEVARQALEREEGLGGEQRQVSVLFVDLIGSTALAQRRPATDVVQTLNALFGAVVRCAGEEGGWVNKFEGDGALCVFGAPDALADHADRALRAARRLRQVLAAEAARHDGLDAGIAVSSGPVVAGNVGAERRYEYTVIGDPVNEAARLVEEAKRCASRVLASQSSVDAAGDEAREWRPVGELELRGRAAPTRAFEPIA